MAELIDTDIVINGGVGNWRVGVVERKTDDDSFLYEIVHRSDDFAGEILARIHLVKGEGFIVSTQASNPDPDAENPSYKWENPVTRNYVAQALEEAKRFAYARNAELAEAKRKADADAQMLQSLHSQFLAALEQRKAN